MPVGKSASPDPANPYPTCVSFTPPSTEVKPFTAAPFQVKAWFTFAVPNKTIPPQSPDCGFCDAEVKTIGLSAVPFAINLAPRQITNDATSIPDFP